MRKLLAIASLLVAMTCSASADFVKISDDLTIHYETAGEGSQVILLVPGWTMTTAVFEKQFAHFKDSKKYKLIALDPRSHGLTTHTSEGNFYEQHGRDLGAFIDALKLKNIVLGGWSYGGFDVLSYLHEFGSSNLKGFVIIDSVPKAVGNDNSPESNEWVWYRKDDADGYRAYFTKGPLLDRQKFNDEFAKYMIDNATPEYLAWISDITNQTGNEVAAILNESACYQDYEADLKGLEGKIPLLYYVGSTMEHRAKAWAKANTPSATVVAFGKHISFWEHPEVFNKALDEYLTKIK